MPPRTAKHPAGSAAWVLDERLQAANAVTHEADDFAFSASNHMEWLNEHMAEIFSRNPLTPMTARKRNALEERAVSDIYAIRIYLYHANQQPKQPLTDVFASTPNAHASPSHNTQFFKQVSKFQVAEDKENQYTAQPQQAISGGLGKENTDSGYHDMTDDDTEPEIQAKSASPPKPLKPLTLASPPPKPAQLAPRLAQFARLEQQHFRRSETVDSFVSAKESPASKVSSNGRRSGSGPVESDVFSVQTLPSVSGAFPADVVMDDAPNVTGDAAEDAPTPVQLNRTLSEEDVLAEPASPTKSDTDDLSEASSPERPILRKKSSLTFATLPARETILPKKSIGARMSRADHAEGQRYTQIRQQSPEQQAEPAPRRSSKRQSRDNARREENGDIGDQSAPTAQEIPESKAHNKTSTQRLHERITMLGKMNPQRPSKSISAAGPAQSSGREVAPAFDKPPAAASVRDEDDDWIGPIPAKTQEIVMPPDTQRPSTFLQETIDPVEQGQVESVVGTEPNNLPRRPMDLQQSKVMYPDLPSTAAGSTTPAGSPVRKAYAENPLSASKTKLFDMFKSARSIFASSAGASAQAKLQALPPQTAQPEINVEAEASDDPPPVLRAMESVQSPVRKVQNPEPALKARRSSARVQEQKAQQAIKVEQERTEAKQEDRVRDEDVKSVAEVKPAEPKKTALVTSHLSKHGELRRPAAKATQEPQPKGRPAPVSIRVASQSQRVGHPSTATLGSSLHETLAQPSQQKPAATLKTKGSNSSMKSGLTGTIGKSGVASSARPKALEAAARKKEQRKADQKREIERRRAAKADEERRAAQELKEQKLAEQRALEAKHAAQRQAAEQRRAEALKKAEQPARPQTSMAQHEQPPSWEQTNPARNDFRPLSKMSMNQDSARPPIPHINPAKPPKRYFDPEEDDHPKRTFGQKSGGPIQQAQNPVKRRRTSEIDGPAEGSSRPAMAPPMRLSTMQKTAAPSKFTPGYISASSSSQAGATSMLKSAINGQHQSHHHPKTPHDLAKFSNAKIPFSDATNSHAPQTVQRPQPGLFKTPGTANSKHGGAKSSPNFPEGDNISLPDIATDSEDEDSDDEAFIPPEWANSPALRELLSQQQLVDPLKVFGPIAPLQMEEIFKGNKERIVKFRKRTSSANWSGADRLTEEERRRDFEAREKLVRDGGWTFNPNM
ncbi:hypothetical protein FH972_023638 [Carpinus fangiana]|uniref:Inner centromere protein ARK-binding domain-containing protein n=1 Tax=Carpinus fangiana TaxID=176857 RepID=A0A5N6KW95_9ROSI|nr:hypothetical protein FH972_023638 [Carpinus fangiana]